MPLIKPFSSYRARAVAIPIQVYSCWYLFNNFWDDNPIPIFLGLNVLALVLGAIVNEWVKHRKRQKELEATWCTSFPITDKKDDFNSVNERLSALEAERDQLRKIADEAKNRADRIEAEYASRSGNLDRKSAIEILGLEEGFTDAELKRQRIEMIKRSHPDQGGSHGLAKIVNEAFELLKK